MTHDPQKAVAEFLDQAPPEVAIADEQAIACERWYHTIDLPGGVTTSGRFDHRPLVPYYGLPESMVGMRALDVGTGDGFWAFEMERRGADVVALELPALKDRDFPAGAKPLVGGPAPGRRFELARVALGSQAELVRLAVYDISPERLGTFDLVHVGDVLLHLRDPPGALAAIHSVTSGSAHIADAVSPALDRPGHNNLVAYHGGWHMTTWWTPSVQALAQMTLDAGFAHVDVLRTYQLEMRGGSGGWRAILRATA